MRKRFDPGDICGNLDDPLPLTLDPPLVDWTVHATTADQVRIENALDAMPLGGKIRLLHVGVGNSRLATRFASRVELIDGLTVVESEWLLANSLGIGNYRVHLLNKYSPRLVRVLGRRYDFIVDNNLTSYACCTYHLYRMFENYRWLLRPDGRVLTDEEGLGWRADARPGWELSLELLAAIAARFGLLASEVTGTVYELRRPR